jgi:two-component system, cell cycle response regulator DivK
VGNQELHIMSDLLRSKPRSKTRILLVEDNDINRRLLADYLNYCGYEVTSIADGADFFLTLTQFQPQLVLLDLKLPNVDGYSILKQLQQKPQFQHIPVIVVSAYAFEQDQRRAMRLGAFQYVVKPLHLEQLELVIQKAIHHVCCTSLAQ